MAKRSRYLVALLFDADVTSEIDGLRRALGSGQLNRIPPHITLVPPLNLPDDDEVPPEQIVRGVASSLQPFSLQLGPSATFDDNQAVLFLEVGAHPSLDRLRVLLHAAIPQARARDRRAFVPHVTLLSLREGDVSATLIDALSQYLCEVRIEALTLMTQVEDEHDRPWRVVSSYDLGASASVGRGGVEIFLHAGRSHSDAVEAALKAWGIAPQAPRGGGGDPYFAIALVGPALAGIARWSEHGQSAELDVFVVAPEHRGVGVGTRLLDFVEGLARKRERRLLVASLDPMSELAHYFRGRNFVQMGDLGVFGDARREFARVLL